MSRHHNDMSLAARSTQFGSLLEGCAMSLAGGKAVSIEQGMDAAMGLLTEARSRNRSVYVIGNGGSAAIASHVAIDLVNAGKTRAYTLHDSALLTCMANDYGYEQAFARLLGSLAQPGDLLIAISSSGRSRNICNAVERMTAMAGCQAVTLSGFAADNPLRSLGNVNVWLDSSDYGLVEVAHQFILHNMADRLRISVPQQEAQ